MRRLPIRIKLALWSAALSSVAIVIFAGATLVEIHEEQIEAADMELVTESRLITQLVPSGKTLVEVLNQSPKSTEKHWVSFGVLDADDRLWRWGSAAPEAVARAALPPGRPRTVSHDGGRWRAQAFPLGAETLIVTYDTKEMEEEIWELFFACTMALPLAAVAVGLGAWWLAGRALAPVRELTDAAAAISSSNLDRRVPNLGARDEVGRLASVFNAMLARLETSFRQAERFAADASHELRTPLTIIRGEIESMLRRPDLPPDWEGSLVSLQEEAGRLERTAEQLLLLARFDAGKAFLGAETVDLGALVADVCEDAEMLAAARSVTIETLADTGSVLPGNGELLRRLLLNLLDNATKFNRPGGRVECRLARNGNGLELTIGNSGPGIPPALRPLVFERFSRSDAARTGSGHGLGLAICREIARVHQGDVELVAVDREDWTEFRVTLPGK